MGRRWAGALSVTLAVAAIAALIVLDRIEDEAQMEAAALSVRSDVSSPPPLRSTRIAPAAVAVTEPAEIAEPVETAPETPKRVLYLHRIDDIKHEIYAREIESVDRLHLLDDLVQTGDMDTRVLWNRDWSGVDDWKREQNGFTLESTEDGTLLFHPDQATMDLYSFYETLEPYVYDEQTQSFVSEVDYYGKPIRNVLKFINEDTLVMMTISGDKVDLNIYGDTRILE